MGAYEEYQKKYKKFGSKKTEKKDSTAVADESTSVHDSTSAYERYNAKQAELEKRSREFKEKEGKRLAEQTLENLNAANKSAEFDRKTAELISDARTSGKGYSSPIESMMYDNLVRAGKLATDEKTDKINKDIDKSKADYYLKRDLRNKTSDFVNTNKGRTEDTVNIHKASNKFNSQFANDDEYTDAFNRMKYGNMNYTQLKDLSQAPDISLSDRAWINRYAEEKKTSKDVDDEIKSLNRDMQSDHMNSGRVNLTDMANKRKEDPRAARITELAKEREKLKASEEKAQRLGEKINYYESLKNNDDFAEITKKGKSRSDNAVMNDSTPVKIGRNDNPVMNWISEKAGENDGFYMSDKEKNIYSYLLEKEGRESAEEYRRFLQDELNQRKASLEHVGIGDSTTANLLTAVPSGFNRFREGVESATNLALGDEALPTSKSRYVSMLARDTLKDKGPKVLGNSVGQMAYDAIENTANMAPAAIFGIAGAGEGLSAGALGLTAGADSANEAWRDGYDKTSATVYGAVNGALEGGLQYVLGGISSFGGKLSGVTKNYLKNKVKSAAGKAIIDTGLGALGEGTEEYLQEILDPVVRNLTLGEDNAVKFCTNEALYSGLIGALTGGMMEGSSNLANAKNDVIIEGIGKSLDDDKIESLVNYAKNTGELKGTLDEYTADPSDINAGKLKLSVDKHIGDTVADMVETGVIDEKLNDMDEYISGIANEAINDAKERMGTDEVIPEDVAEMPEEVVMNTQYSADKPNTNANGYTDMAGAEDVPNVGGATGERSERFLSKTLDSFSDSSKEALNTALEGAVVDETTFKNAFANYYSYGRAGISLETAEKNAVYRDELTESQKKLAYESGKNDRANALSNQALEGRTFKGKGMLRYVNENEISEGIAIPDRIKNLNSRQKSSIMALRVFAEASGQNIALYQSKAVDGKITAPNGWYSRKNDTIYIDVNAGDVGENAMLRTASHEITHSIKEWAPERYKALQDYFIERLEKDNSLEAMINEEIRLAEKNGQKLTYDEAMDEVTANCCEMMLKDSEAIKNMAKSSPDIVGKIKEVIDRFVEDIKKAFEGLRSGSIEHKRMSELLDDWTEVQKMWDKAVLDSAENAKSASKNSDTQLDDDIKHSYRGDTRSNREILADALMSATKNSSERNSLETYKKTIGSLDMLEKYRREKTKQLKDVQTAEERKRLQKDIADIEKKITYNDKMLLSLEATLPLQNVIKREVKANTEQDIEYIKKRYSENRKRRQMTALRNNIKSNSNSLISILNKPTNQRHVPEGLKRPLTEFLTSIDFISAYAEPDSFNTKVWTDKMNSLQSMLRNTERDGGAIDFDPDLIERMGRFAEDNSGKKLSSMSMEQLEELYIIVRSLRMGISNQNRMFANKRSENAEKLGWETMQYLKDLKGKKDHAKVVESVDSLLNVDMLDPASYFKAFGKSGESILKELEDGDHVKMRDLKEAGDYIEKVYVEHDITKKDIEMWTGKKAPLHKFTIGDREISMTKGQIMSLYELSKREQARKHLYSDGMRPDVIDRGGRKINQVGGTKISEAMVNQITSTLTEKEKAFADAVQSYLSNECAKKGNATSMLMYGYKKFTEKDYFPIKVDRDTTRTSSANKEDKVAMRSIINKGMTKNINEHAENTIVIRDIYDVYADHVVDMADYHGLAAPITDALKWFDMKYKTGDERYSVKEEIHRVFGQEYQKYFENLIMDVNGEKIRRNASDLMERAIGNYKASAVAGNIRVVVQQPTAYIRAWSMIDSKYLIKAFSEKPAMKEATENSALAWWKSAGYYDTGIGPSFKNLVTRQQSIKDRIVDSSLYLAGKADDITWGYLWNAVKHETADKNKNLDRKSKEFMEKVKDRFEDVIYSTQVVDATFAKSQIMRSKNGATKQFTSFMAEPIKSYNMLRNAVVSKDVKTVARTTATFVTTAVATAFASSFIDSMRSLSYDDDKDKDFSERFGENFEKNVFDNVAPYKLIPYVKDIAELIEGGTFNTTSNRQEIAWAQSLMKSAQEVIKALSGSSKKTPVQIIKMCSKTISQISGVPAYNVYRDVEAVYNEIKKDALGEESADKKAYDAVKALLNNSDKKTYDRKVRELKEEGYNVEEVNKLLEKGRNKVKREKKNDKQSTTTSSGSRSIYKASDISNMVGADDINGANEIAEQLYQEELEQNEGNKDARYEAFKKVKGKIRQVITKEYKALPAGERIQYAKKMKKIKVAKQSIYTDKDIEVIEKAIAKERGKN